MDKESEVNGIVSHEEIEKFVMVNLENIKGSLNKDLEIFDNVEIREAFNTSDQEHVRFRKSYEHAMKSLRLKKQAVEDAMKAVLICVSVELKTIEKPPFLRSHDYETIIIARLQRGFGSNED